MFIHESEEERIDYSNELSDEISVGGVKWSILRERTMTNNYKKESWWIVLSY